MKKYEIVYTLGSDPEPHCCMMYAMNMSDAIVSFSTDERTIVSVTEIK